MKTVFHILCYGMCFLPMLVVIPTAKRRNKAQAELKKAYKGSVGALHAAQVKYDKADRLHMNSFYVAASIMILGCALLYLFLPR